MRRRAAIPRPAFPRLAAAAPLAAALVLSLVAPRAARAIVSPRYGAVVSVLAKGPVGTLDPTQVGTPAEKDIAMALFEGLVRGSAHEPAAAASWSSSDDGRTWTFHLRPGMTFTDGSPVDAASFVSSWKRVPSSPAAAPFLAGIAASAADDSTLVLRLDKRLDDLLDRLALPALVAVRRADEGSLIGSGPFRLAGMSEGAFTLVPRLDHHAGRAFPRRIVVHSSLEAPGKERTANYHIVDFPGAGGAAAGSPDWEEVPFPSARGAAERTIRVRRNVAGLQVDPVSGSIRFEDLWVNPGAGS